MVGCLATSRGEEQENGEEEEEEEGEEEEGRQLKGEMKEAVVVLKERECSDFIKYPVR